jgi:hypothetical protein
MSGDVLGVRGSELIGKRDAHIGHPSGAINSATAGDEKSHI